MAGLDLIPLAISAVTFSAGALAWYRGAVQKQYAAERAFQHLERNLQTISGAIADLDRRLEQIERDQLEIKALLATTLRGHGESSGFFGRKG